MGHGRRSRAARAILLTETKRKLERSLIAALRSQINITIESALRRP
jgi:hypothetical protein